MRSNSGNSKSNSLRIFRRFITRDAESGTLDVSGILSSACYEEWLHYRRERASDVQARRYHRILTNHVSGVDKRVPFTELEEAAILDILRNKKPWPCFPPHLADIGRRFRCRGYHEKLLLDALAHEKLGQFSPMREPATVPLFMSYAGKEEKTAVGESIPQSGMDDVHGLVETIMANYASATGWVDWGAIQEILRFIALSKPRQGITSNSLGADRDQKVQAARMLCSETQAAQVSGGDVMVLDLIAKAAEDRVLAQTHWDLAALCGLPEPARQDLYDTLVCLCCAILRDPGQSFTCNLRENGLVRATYCMDPTYMLLLVTVIVVENGYTLDSCALALRVVDLKSRVLHGTVAYRLVKAPAAPAAAYDASEANPVLRLNARNLGIDSIKINAQECAFTLLDFLNKDTAGNITNLSSFSACLTGDLAVANEGELCIQLPSTVVSAADGPQEMLVEISYHTLSSATGVCVFKASEEEEEENGEAAWHMFTRIALHSSTNGCGARCLFPCIDNSNKFKLPKLCLLIECARAHVAFAPGRLLSITPATDSTHVYEFEHHGPIAPSSINLCVGAFYRHTHHQAAPWLTTWSLASRSYRTSTQANTTVFAQSLHDMTLYLLGQTTTLPGHTQVFVDTEEVLIPGSTLAFLPDSFQHDAECEWTSKTDEARALLYQLAGVALQSFAQTCADTWIPMGLALFCALRSLPRAMQSLILHEWEERISQTNARADRVASLVSRPGLVLARALMQPKSYALPVDSALWQLRAFDFDSTFACKAGFVMHMLEQRAGAQAFQSALQRVVAYGRSKPESNMSELAFLTLVKARASQLGTNRQLAMDIDATFVNQWLRRSHVPQLSGAVSYNAKTNQVEVTIRQQQGRIYMGAVKLRIVESSGETWDYEKQIDNAEHRWMFDLRAPKKLGKGGRKRHAEEEKKVRWRHPEALTPDELLQMGGSRDRHWESKIPVRYVVLDPDNTWMMDLEWKQPEEFWLELLHDSALNDRIGMQIWALRQFANGTQTLSQRTSAVITALAMDVNRHDAVRVAALDAALALHQRFAPATAGAGAAASSGTSWVCADLLVFVFKRLYCSAETGEPLPFTVNNGEYAVRSRFLQVLSLLRAQDGSMPEEVLEVALDSIRMCDNSGNPFDDGPMLASLAICAGNICRVMTGGAQPSSTTGGVLGEDMEEALRWIKSALDFDMFSPNPRKLTTIGCLRAFCELELAQAGGAASTAATAGEEMVDFAAFLQAGDAHVRLTAFQCLFRIQVLHRKDFNALAVLLRHEDVCLVTQHKMIKYLLSAYADSRGECFLPLRCAGGTRNAQVEQALWDLLHAKSAFDSELRMLVHQFWLHVYGLDFPGTEFGLKNLGKLQNWAADSQGEWNRDEDSLLHMENIPAMQEKQREVLREKELEAKRLKLEQEQEQKLREQEQQQQQAASAAAATAAAATTTTMMTAAAAAETTTQEQVMMGEEEIIMMDEEEDMDMDMLEEGEDEYDDLEEANENSFPPVGGEDAGDDDDGGGMGGGEGNMMMMEDEDEHADLLDDEEEEGEEEGEVVQ